MDKIEQLLSGRKKKKSSSPKNLSQEVRKSNLSQEQCRTRKGKPIESSSKKKKSKERTVETFEACETKEEQTKEEDPAADKKKTEKFAEAEQELATAPWYHGLMPREEILEMLTKDGDFLVRKTEVGLHPHYALSVWSDNKPHHMLLKLNDQYRWYVSKTKNFDKIREMVDFYMKNTDKTFMPNKLVTKNPVLRPPWYIIHENVVLIKKLGEGNFGEVHLGSYLTQTGALLQVAVKVLKGKLGKKERVAFVKEASLMRRYQHKHIVRMFGIASQKEPIMILLELAANGSLKGHIHDHPELPVDHLRRYTLEAALGMEFLAANNVIHRDIAARNCLLTKEDSVKISDFGLSSNKGQVTETMLKNVPVKWLAPETLLKGVFNIKTDVYSFGIMMWEIFTKCQKDPYPDINNKEARKNIINGVFNVIPDGIPDDVVAVMKRCWTFNPDDRPGFDHIVRDLGGQAATKSFLSAAVDKNDNYVEEEYFNLPK